MTRSLKMPAVACLPIQSQWAFPWMENTVLDVPEVLNRTCLQESLAFPSHIYLSIYLSIYLYLSVYLSIYLSHSLSYRRLACKLASHEPISVMVPQSRSLYCKLRDWSYIKRIQTSVLLGPIRVGSVVKRAHDAHGTLCKPFCHSPIALPPD